MIPTDTSMIFRFVQFFEQLALLRQKGLVDSELIFALMAPDLKFYGGHMLRPLAQLPEHPDFVGRLRLIDRQLLEPTDGIDIYASS